MKRTNWNAILAASCIFCVLAGLAPAASQTGASKLMVAFEKAPAKDVFKQMASMLNCELVLDDRVTGKITVTAVNLPRLTALDITCASIDARCDIQGGILTVSPLAKDETPQLILRSKPYTGGLDRRLPSGLRYENVPPGRAMIDVFRYATVACDFYGESLLKGNPVTIDVSNLSVAEAVTRILENSGVKEYKIMQTLEDNPAYIIFTPSGR
jgi:hypothetical protein